mmetsp:Transcript_34273/g.103292  ORF Transcript_34273/g.103292 Transcript_34273/m.103292 type:complete len:292 (+) Transcript_34273:741-1616(+)
MADVGPLKAMFFEAGWDDETLGQVLASCGGNLQQAANTCSDAGSPDAWKSSRKRPREDDDQAPAGAPRARAVVSPRAGAESPSPRAGAEPEPSVGHKPKRPASGASADDAIEINDDEDDEDKQRHFDYLLRENERLSAENERLRNELAARDQDSPGEFSQAFDDIVGAPEDADQRRIRKVNEKITRVFVKFEARLQKACGVDRRASIKAVLRAFRGKAPDAFFDDFEQLRRLRNDACHDDEEAAMRVAAVTDAELSDLVVRLAAGVAELERVGPAQEVRGRGSRGGWGRRH